MANEKNLEDLFDAPTADNEELEQVTGGAATYVRASRTLAQAPVALYEGFEQTVKLTDTVKAIDLTSFFDGGLGRQDWVFRPGEQDVGH